MSFLSADEFVSAAIDGEIDIVREAIEGGQDVNVKNSYGDTALIWASRLSNTDIVRELLSGGATVDLTDNNGYTALIEASRYGRTDIVRVLLSGGATVDLTDNYGYTALIEASSNSRTDAVRELLSGGATVDLTNNDGKTALMVARKSWNPNPETISLLEEAGRNASTTHHQTNQDSPVPVQTETTPDKELTEPLSHTLSTEPLSQTVKSKHSSPPRHPLIQTQSFPGVTFFSDPQEMVLSQHGAHAKFDNGVKVTVSPHTLPPKSTASVTVHPGFASKDIFVLPQDVLSASPAYLIDMTGSEVTGEVTITIQHHVNVKTQEEADNLCFLQADTSPSRSGSYKYTQPPDSRSEFKAGENRGTLTTRRFSEKFFKVGMKKIKKLFGASNRYTVRVYRSPPQTTGDKIAIVGVSLYGRLYSKFLESLDTVIIPRDYPEVSTKVADRTNFESLCFRKSQTDLDVHSVNGWIVEPDKQTIFQREVDMPERGNFKLEDLRNYPPRIVCRFYPDGRPPKRTTCTLSITGFDDEVKVHVPLKAPKAATVDTTKLQEASVKLKSTAVSVKETELGSTVATILTLMDSITTALLSSSLTDLAAQTDSIKKEVKTVLKVSRKVTEKCSVQIIKDNLEVSLSKIEVLSHQLCQVAKVKLNFCQDLSDETTALSDLVTNAAGLMTAIDTLLKDISFTNTTPAYNALKVCGEMVVEGLILDPKAIALSLFSAGFISETTLHETNDLNEIKCDKGRRLYKAVLGTVKSHPHKYHQFTAILRKDELLHKDLLLALEQAYK